MTKKEMNNKIFIVMVEFLIVFNGILAFMAYQDYHENIPDQSAIIIFENCQSYENHDKKIDCFLKNDIGQTEKLENWIQRKSHYKLTIHNIFLNSWAVLSLMIVIINIFISILFIAFVLIDKFFEY